ncbi:bifunctional UDP-N-acetylglucosamine diphosphorylase/glucosamine-1-phosphate N-acetyltransferase GlmU [Priestia filamentosa]|uniref:bifunctional UDP-N-acetylglucosamine diphosphorylase/glucosamine-1-phosphate N-acetyltransferase GlmU n=1 Tax=Priestia filamentosa TaxID=1402861 RepID=UPI00068A4768
MNKYAIVLAAGKGTRMKSDLPKVLHPVCGKPMLQHIIDKLKEINIQEIIVVIGHKGDQIKKTIKDPVTFVEQDEQKGTAHAVQQAMPQLADKEGTTLVITGDTPLITADTLNSFLNFHIKSNAKGTVLTATHDNPTGYGRIIREHSTSNDVNGIVEEKDASSSQKEIKEVNTGIFAFDNSSLLKYLPQIKNNNAQNEYYLTDIVSVFLENHLKFGGYTLNDPTETMGINSRIQLSEAERIFRKRINAFHMDNGVTIIDPDNTYIEDEVVIRNDTVIYPGCFISGKTVIGSNVTIYPYSIICNVIIEDGSIIKNPAITNLIVNN